MLANFASPWNCIYSAARLKEDPLFPKTHVLGTGPFVFVEHVKGNHWSGQRWDKYFLAGRPYLDGYRAEFISGDAAVNAMESGRIMVQFRSFTPTERGEMAKAAGDRVEVREGPWISYLPSLSTPLYRRSMMRGCGGRCRSRSTAGKELCRLPTIPFSTDILPIPGDCVTRIAPLSVLGQWRIALLVRRRWSNRPVDPAEAQRHADLPASRHTSLVVASSDPRVSHAEAAGAGTAGDRVERSGPGKEIPT